MRRLTHAVYVQVLEQNLFFPSYFSMMKSKQKSSQNEASARPARILSSGPFRLSRPDTGIPTIAGPPFRLAPAPEEQTFIILTLNSVPIK